MKKDYVSKFADFAEESYPNCRSSKSSLTISRRQKIAKNLKMMSKVVSDCGCIVGIDKHIETIYIEGSSVVEVDGCLGVLEVYYNFKPIESLSFEDGSKVAWIKKKSGKEELAE